MGKHFPLFVGDFCLSYFELTFDVRMKSLSEIERLSEWVAILYHKREKEDSACGGQNCHFYMSYPLKSHWCPHPPSPTPTEKHCSKCDEMLRNLKSFLLFYFFPVTYLRAPLSPFAPHLPSIDSSLIYSCFFRIRQRDKKEGGGGVCFFLPLPPPGGGVSW